MTQKMDRNLHVAQLLRGYEGDVEAEAQQGDALAIRMMDGVLGDDGQEHPFSDEDVTEALETEDAEIDHLILEIGHNDVRLDQVS